MDDSRPRQLSKANALCVLGLALLVLVAFHGVAGFGPINLDDPVALERNAMVNQLHIGHLASALWYVGPLNLWHPATWWSHQLDTAVFGFPAWGARHLVNLALHAATVGLLFVFLFRLTGSRAGAFFGAALFAIHPQRVEAVAWLTARKELLAGVFVLLACLWWLEWRRTGGAWRWWLSFLAFGGALLSHPVVVVLPVVLVLLDRCCGENAVRPARRPGLPGVEHGAFFAGAALVALGTLWIHRGGGLSGLEASHGTGDRIGRILLGAWHYASACLWPHQQRLFAIPPGDSGALQAMAIGGIAVLAAVVFAIRRLVEEDLWVPLLGLGWMLLFFLPVSGLVAMSPYLGADRYTYLPLMGLALIIAWFWPRGIVSRWVAGGAGAILLLILLPLTQRRLADWKNSEALFRAEVEASPRSKLAPLHLGAALLDSGDPGQALVWFERSLKIDPKFDLALHNAALARRRLEQQAAPPGAKTD